MAKKIWAFLGIFLLVSTAVASPLRPDQASANGATRLIVQDVREGPYLFRVGILPGSPKVGNLHLNVLIQSADGSVFIDDGQITVMATGPEPGMTAGPVLAANTPQNRQLFDADITLTDLGMWNLTLETTSSLGDGTLVVPLQVTESGGFNLLIVVVIFVVVVAVAALVWSRKQPRRRPT